MTWRTKKEEYWRPRATVQHNSTANAFVNVDRTGPFCPSQPTAAGRLQVEKRWLG